MPGASRPERRLGSARVARGFVVSAGVPVVMFHGVAPDRRDRPPQVEHWLDPERFEAYLANLRREGWRTLFLDELRRYKAGEIDLPRRSVALTFDDGYLDFWLYAFPLLEKYDARATAFVPLDFVEEGERPRRAGDGVPWGHLNWAELLRLEASGRVDVQGHAKTHTWYAVGPRLVDVHRPGLPWELLRFVWWNRFPERKPVWLREARHDDVPFGVPILEHEKSLLAKRYLPAESIERGLVQRVAEAGGAAFFGEADWRERYRGWYEAEIEAAGESAGRYETEDERRARLQEELLTSRVELGRRLGKEVRYLCCPGGSLSAEVLSSAPGCGYSAVTIPASWGDSDGNRPGGDPSRLHRVPSGSIFRRFRSPRADALSFRLRVGSEVGLVRDRAAWTGLRMLRRLRLL